MNVFSRPTAALAALAALGTVLAGSAGLLVPASAAAIPGSVSSSSSVGLSIRPSGSSSTSTQRRYGPEPSWFVDQLSPAQRAAQIRVPSRPARFKGQRLRYTRALQRTRASHLAVPASLAYGHELLAGQALTFDAAALFRPHSARLTAHAARVVVRLAYSMAHVTSARCEGYMDYGRAPVRTTSRLSLARAHSLCSALAGQTGGLATTEVGYGSARPAVVGGGPALRAANRRVVLVVKANLEATGVAGPPTITAATYSRNLSARKWDFDLTWSTPDSDGGNPITGYEWSIDGGTTWTAFDLVSPDGATHSAIVNSGISYCTSGTSTVLIRAVTSAGSGTPSAGYDISYDFQGLVRVRNALVC